MRQEVRETTELKGLSEIFLQSIHVEVCERNIAHIALFLLLPGWKLTFLHEFHGQLLIDLGQLLLDTTIQRMTSQSTDENIRNLLRLVNIVLV